MEQSDRAKIRAACSLIGSIKAVAGLASVDRGHLTKWLAGQNTLGVDKIAAVLAALGFTNEGIPDQGKIHEWQLGGTAGMRKDWKLALRLFFPHGAKIYFAPWTATNSPLESLTSSIKSFFDQEIYALTDGRTRAILRAPSGMWGVLDDEIENKFLSLEGKMKKERLINITKHDKNWISGGVSVEEFNKRCGILCRDVSFSEIEEEIKTLGITNAEALIRIKNPTAQSAHDEPPSHLRELRA